MAYFSPSKPYSKMQDVLDEFKGLNLQFRQQCAFYPLNPDFEAVAVWFPDLGCATWINKPSRDFDEIGEASIDPQKGHWEMWMDYPYDPIRFTFVKEKGAYYFKGIYQLDKQASKADGTYLIWKRISQVF